MSAQSNEKYTWTNGAMILRGRDRIVSTRKNICSSGTVYTTNLT